jgi:hypothetical protein
MSRCADHIQHAWVDANARSGIAANVILATLSIARELILLPFQ